MLSRLLIAILCLASAAWLLDYAQRTGRFQKVDEGFLSFMVSQAQGCFEKTTPHAQVALVEMRTEDRAEYATWPPPPLDWQMIIKELQNYQPEILVIASPLNWGLPTPDFAPAVAEALLKFPSVILGVEAPLAAGDAPDALFPDGLEALLPRFQEVTGDTASVPRLSFPIVAPDAVIRPAGEGGLLCMRQVDGEWRLPYAVRDRDSLLPTLLAQTLARHTRTPYSGSHTLHLNAGSGAYLQDGWFVPLRRTGEYIVRPGHAAPAVNALDMMTGVLVDGLSETDKAHLENASIIVIGTTSADTPGATPSLPRLYANALNHLLALPRLQKLSLMEQWAVSGIAMIAALWIILLVPRQHAVLAGLSLMLVALVFNFLVFKSHLIWCPPTAPFSLILLGMLLAQWPKKAKSSLPAPAAPYAAEVLSAPEKTPSPEAPPACGELPPAEAPAPAKALTEPDATAAKSPPEAPPAAEANPPTPAEAPPPSAEGKPAQVISPPATPDNPAPKPRAKRKRPG
ncbi:hypothetical protein WJU23_19580 [Prosthecobacter sp. SYSU 5D2]|uniref:hypothetical protein n=1 Tax=Prosthecobacter sp. SYSU 5D2 TaxID=3134134 RepID=UPI0031FF330E